MQGRSPSGFVLKGMKMGKLIELSQAVSNFIYISPNNHKRLMVENLNKKPVYVQVKGYIFIADVQKNLTDQESSIHKYARQFMKISETYDLIDLIHFPIPESQEYRLSVINFEIEPIDLKVKMEVEENKLQAHIKKLYSSHFFATNQIVYFEFEGGKFIATVNSTSMMETGITNAKIAKEITAPLLSSGMIVAETDIEVTCRKSANFKIKGDTSVAQNIFRPDFKFEDLGVGGLDKEMFEIFRQAFFTRRFSPSALARYKMSHIKGIVLYGPPGTGKTLIARQLAKVLKAKEPKIVNGPELFSKYVGESQANVRKLFDDARQDQTNLGDDSPLHIIIFDEFDAIAKARGRDVSGTGVHDDVVNQLLSMIDGVESLNNILVIGMTNRLDLIDKAILRPGRFAVKIEVSLPDEAGRLQILNIHTDTMRKNKLIHPEVDLAKVAKMTKNFTGAEIEDLVKQAATFSFQRNNDMMNFSKDYKLNENSVIETQDFNAALAVCKPEFGVDADRFEVFLREPLIDYGHRYQNIISTIRIFMNQVRNGQSQLMSVLLEGNNGTGKTSIASWAAVHSEFPFVKMLSPDMLIGMTEIGKINLISRTFEDAYKSKLSVLVLDNIEGLAEYIQIGPRFSSGVLHALRTLVKEIPKKEENRLLIVGTTSNIDILRDLDIANSFNAVIAVGDISGQKELSVVFNKFGINNVDFNAISSIVGEIPMKKLILLIKLALSRSAAVTPEIIKECFASITDKKEFVADKEYDF